MAKARQPVLIKDEDDIVDELKAESVDRGDPTGPVLVTDEESIRKAGAVDTDTIRRNRMNQIAVDRKVAGEKNIVVNEPDILLKYEVISKMWLPATMLISLKRVGGGADGQWVITSEPKDGTELYDAIALIHGKEVASKYSVSFSAKARGEGYGSGYILMPDTRDKPQQQPQQGQLMPYVPTPPGYVAPQYAAPAPAPAPQGTDISGVLALQKQMFEMMQSMQRGGAPAQAPQQAPPQVQALAGGQGMDLSSMVALQKQMFEMMQALQSGSPQPAQPVYAAPAVAPSTGVDLGSMIALQKQMFEMMQQMQPPPVAQQPQSQQVPPVQPPPGTMFVPGFGFVPVARLVDAISPQPPQRGPYAPPRYDDGRYQGYRPPAEAYPQGPPGGTYPQQGAYPQQGTGTYPQRSGPYTPGYPQQPPYGAPPQPPEPPRSAADQFRDAIGLVRSAVDAATTIQGIMPGQQPVAPAAPEPVDDDSPVQVTDAGGFKLVTNRHDGSARYWETGIANADKILRWVGEQREAIQTAQQKRQEPARLPPGYVEMTPGYQPPPGYVAIPVDHQLPAPPQNLPPPIDAPPAPRRTWDVPNTGGR